MFAYWLLIFQHQAFAADLYSTALKRYNAHAHQPLVSLSRSNRLQLEKGEVVVLDVRTEDEFSSGHVKGALNADVNSTGFMYQIQGLDKGKDYVVYCHSGRRSVKASDILINEGFTSVTNVEGGIVAWKDMGYDVVME